MYVRNGQNFDIAEFEITDAKVHQLLRGLAGTDDGLRYIWNFDIIKFDITWFDCTQGIC